MEGTSEGFTYTTNFFWHQRSADLLGHGAFGKVHKGRNRETGEFVAVKTCGKDDVQQHAREIDILQQMNSPFIVKFIAAEMTMDEPSQTVLILELADGSVRDELKKLENMYGLSLSSLLLLIEHLSKGLSYLNSKMIAHRDVKPENILIFNKLDGITFKLCDFGGSRFVTDNSQPLVSICGTPGYLNVYTAGNLARKEDMPANLNYHRKKFLLSYTKDECDLWSVGCTLFECATGLLPFMPRNGPRDTAGMYKMMIARPSDAIYGRIDDAGQFLWENDFPRGHCMYPKSFRRVLCEFICHLFDRCEATRLTFDKFDSMCNELLNLKRIRVFKMNTLLFEEYFDTSNAKHFKSSTFDEYAKADMPAHDLICVLTIPAEAAAYKPPAVPASLIEHHSDIVIMGLENGNHTMPTKLPEPIVDSLLTRFNRSPTLREIKHVAANTLRLERQMYELQDTVPGLITFLRTMLAELQTKFRNLKRDFDCAKRVTEHVRLLSEALAMSKETAEERKAVESNAHLIVRELRFIDEWLKSNDGKLQKIGENLKSVEQKPIIKQSSLKNELETVVKLRTCSPSIGIPDPFMETDRNFLLHSYEKTMRAYDEKLQEVYNLCFDSLKTIIANIFDFTRDLHKKDAQLKDSQHLITATEETNKRRLEATRTTTTTQGNINSLSSSVDMELPSILGETRQHARQQKIDASNSLTSTIEWLRSIGDKNDSVRVLN